MNSYETLYLQRRDAVAIVTLNRPHKLNAINPQMRTDLMAATQQVNADESIRVVVIAGAGRSFCAGADLSAEQPADSCVESILNQEYKHLLMAITDAPKPWISAVQGAAAGIGGALAMNCDLTLMGENAYIYQAFAAIGLIPDGGTTWHLAHAVGRKRAYELIAMCEKLSALKCLEYGLCNRVVANESLIDQALDWAQTLASKAPLSLRYAKEAVNVAMTATVAEIISHEARLQSICASSEDAREGRAAFLQKRPPVFKGH